MNSNQAQRPAATHTRPEDSARARRVRAIVVVVSSVTAALVVTGCLLAFGKTLVDRYYLFRLSVAETKADRDSYIQTLTKRRCTGVVPDLLLSIVQLPPSESDVKWWVEDDVAADIASLGAGAIPYLGEVMDGDESDPLFGRRLRDLDDWQRQIVITTAGLALEILAKQDDTAENALGVLLLGLSRLPEAYPDAAAVVIENLADPQSCKLARSIPYHMIYVLRSEGRRGQRAAAKVLRETYFLVPERAVSDVVTALSDVASSSDPVTALAAVDALSAYDQRDDRVLPILERLLRRIDAHVVAQWQGALSEEAELREKLRECIEIIHEEVSDEILKPDGRSADVPGSASRDSDEGAAPVGRSDARESASRKKDSPPR